MKTYQPLSTITIKAAAALTKRRFIGADGNHCGANAKAVGVAEISCDSGEQASIINYGVALVEAGGAITLNDFVTSDANGKAVKANALTAINLTTEDMVVTLQTNCTLTVPPGTHTAQVDGINGFALDAAAQAGDIIRVHLL